MSSIKTTCFLVSLFFLSACSVFEPFVDRRRNAGETDPAKLYIGQSRPYAPAVCSNNLWTEQQKIQALADQECVRHKTGTHAVQTDVKHFSCKLLLPTRTYFKCEK